MTTAGCWWDCPEPFLQGLFTLQNLYTAQFLRLFGAVFFFLASTCTLSSSWRHYSTNWSADDTSWGEQSSVISHLDGTSALAFASLFSHRMIFADKSVRIWGFLPPWYLWALGVDLHCAAEPEPASANLRAAGCCLSKILGSSWLSK